MVLSEDIKNRIIEEYNSFKPMMYAGKTKEERNDLGQFFTPPELTIKMIEKFDEIKPNATYIDPTFGAGNLLAGMIIAGLSPLNAYGIELDPIMFEVGKERLIRLGVPQSHFESGKDNHFYLGNALEDRSYAFPWHTTKMDKLFHKNTANNNMLFDYVITNPPYDDKLHLDILEHIMSKSNNVVCLHPSNLFASPRLAFSETEELKRYRRLFNSVNDVEILNLNETDKLFGIYTYVQLCISKFNGFNSNINKRTKFIKDDNVKLYNKIVSRIVRSSLKGKDSCDGEYKLHISHVHGHPNNKDLYFLTNLSYESQIKYNGGVHSRCFSFKTEEERHNFYDSLNLNSIILCNKIWKYNQNLIWKYIPWLGDYTKKWTDDMFFEWLKLEKNEIEMLKLA